MARRSRTRRSWSWPSSGGEGHAGGTFEPPGGGQGREGRGPNRRISGGGHLAVQLPQLVSVDGHAAAVHGDDHAEPDRDLARRDDHDYHCEDLAVAVAVHAAEADQREVGRVEHQLEAEQDDQRVAPREHAAGADAEHEGRHDDVPGDAHQPATLVGSPSGRSPSASSAGVPTCPLAASAIVPVPSGWKTSAKVSRCWSSSVATPPRRRARTTAPTAAMSSRIDAASNAKRNLVSSSVPMYPGVPNPRGSPAAKPAPCVSSASRP